MNKNPSNSIVQMICQFRMHLQWSHLFVNISNIDRFHHSNVWLKTRHTSHVSYTLKYDARPLRRACANMMCEPIASASTQSSKNETEKKRGDVKRQLEFHFWSHFNVNTTERITIVIIVLNGHKVIRWNSIVIRLVSVWYIFNITWHICLFRTSHTQPLTPLISFLHGINCNVHNILLIRINVYLYWWTSLEALSLSSYIVTRNSVRIYYM